MKIAYADISVCYGHPDLQIYKGTDRCLDIQWMSQGCLKCTYKQTADIEMHEHTDWCMDGYINAWAYWQMYRPMTVTMPSSPHILSEKAPIPTPKFKKFPYFKWTSYTQKNWKKMLREYPDCNQNEPKLDIHKQRLWAGYKNTKRQIHSICNEHSSPKNQKWREEPKTVFKNTLRGTNQASPTNLL